VYYWFTVPQTAHAAHLLFDVPIPSAGTTIVRAIFLLLPGVWLVRRTSSAV
jgi:hypothetical protein